MKKAIRQIIMCLIVLVLLGFQAMVPCSAESSELLSYDDAIEHLGSISLTDKEELDLVYRSFEAIGSRYFAPQYMYLTQALLDLSGDENVDFNRTEVALTILKSNNAFIDSYTTDESLSYLPLDSLLAYVKARKLEAEGNLEEAYNSYVSNQILDSLDRVMAISISQYYLPTPTPSPTLMPLLIAQADASEGSAVVNLNAAVYDGTTKTSSYSRTELINMLDAEKYTIWDQSGVLTFRGGPLRQNAAYGTVEIEAGTMSVLWKVPVEGTMRMNDVNLTGVGWPGQAAIVKWPMEVRQLLSISTEMKDITALKEVIVGGQNGKLYFLDLTTGAFTRDPVSIGWPSNGSVSVNTDGSPIAAFGQFYSNKADKTRIDNGLHLFNLMNNKELTLLDGRAKPVQTNYSGFSGAPLFDKLTGAMIVGGQNGVFYLADLNTDFDYIGSKLTISPKYHRYTWLAPGQTAKETNVDGSVAMYGPYAYFGDDKGVLQCVDVNTLTPVWAVRTGDAIKGTPALEMSADGGAVSLYAGNMVKSQGKGGDAAFFKFDALSGKILWQFKVEDLSYVSSDPVGIYASPAVGQNGAADAVFFTVTNGKTNSTLYALSKSDGSVKWSAPFEAPAESSPVAVYNEAGDAWIVQALVNGQLLLIDTQTGAVVNTLQLEGEIIASPAVYRNVLIISTTGADPSYIYAIALE